MATAEATRTRNTVLQIALVVAIIGALNWGLIGFFNFNLVDAILGGGAREETNAGGRFIYALVGLCGLIAAIMLPRRSGYGVQRRVQA